MLQAMSYTLPALSIREPWCTLITSGRKAWEYRGWKPALVPPCDLVLCTSKRVEKGTLECLRDVDSVAVDSLHQLGCAVAIARYEGAMDWRKTPEWTLGRPLGGSDDRGYGWHLVDVRLLKCSVPVRGQLGIFKVTLPAEVMP